MRLLYSLLLCSLLAHFAHADEWHDYIQVDCKPDRKFFEVRSLRLPVVQVNGNSAPDIDSIKTSGEIFLKWDKVSWTEVGNGDVRLAKDLGLNIPTCLIEENYPVIKFEHEGRNNPGGIRVEETHSVEFKVVRTSIDQGNVQGQCGAAGSAEFKVFVNDVPLGVFPSARDYCFNRKLGSETVSYSSQGLKHCKYADRMSTSVLDKGNFKTDVTVCHEGTASSYLKYIATMKADISDEDAETIATEIKNDLSGFKLRELYSRVRESTYDIHVEKKKNEALSVALKAKEKEKLNLEAKLEKTRKRSFWGKLFQRDE